MQDDPLATLVRSLTPKEGEADRIMRAQVRNRPVAHLKPRIPNHLATLWCEWNREATDAEALAYEFGKYFSRECLAEWNKPTHEEIEREKKRNKETRRLRYNAYMRKYLKKYRSKPD